MNSSVFAFLPYGLQSAWRIKACIIWGLIQLLALSGENIAQAGSTLLRIVGQGNVTARDGLGTLFMLGSGPFTLDFEVPSPDRVPTARPGQDEFNSAFSDFNMNAPNGSFPRGGQTNQNFILSGREGEPNADFFNFGVFDCSTTACGFPIGSIGNSSEALGFEGMFGAALLPDGTLGTDPFVDLEEFLLFLDALDFADASDTFINSSWVPESLLPPTSANGSNGDTDLKFVFVDGAISDIVYPAPLTNGFTADFDGDGDVDGFDFLKWQRGESPNPFSASDLADWQAQYGAVLALAVSTIVPEPSNAVLLIAMAAVGILPRRSG